MPKFFTIDDLTHELCVSRATAYKLAHQMKYTKVGRRLLIAEPDLLEFIEQNSRFDQDKKQSADTKTNAVI